mmetsp:Transcript_36636/g.53676  ORF Transcript_36636/g.53676 Transcript_36636/m.53676 type:complete len:88 (-) Transcript_36636:945-1208(-)
MLCVFISSSYHANQRSLMANDFSFLCRNCAMQNNHGRCVPLGDADKSVDGLIPREGALVGVRDCVGGALEAMAPHPLSFFVFDGKTT